MKELSKTDALSVAAEVMREVRRDSGVLSRILDRLDVNETVIEAAMVRLIEVHASFENVACAHCDNDAIGGVLDITDKEAVEAFFDSFDADIEERLAARARANTFADVYGQPATGRTRYAGRLYDTPPELTMESAAMGPTVTRREDYPGESEVPEWTFEELAKARKPESLIGRVFRFRQWVRFDPGEKNYHVDIGFPAGFDITRYTRGLPDVLTGTDHYDERREEKKLPPRLSKDWVTRKARVVTITRSSDRALQRYAMRGPWRTGIDLTVVIDAATGFMVTGWFNRSDDWHRLTKTEYARPEEV
jgi:hypothetical protein